MHTPWQTDNPEPPLPSIKHIPTTREQRQEHECEESQRIVRNRGVSLAPGCADGGDREVNSRWIGFGSLSTLPLTVRSRPQLSYSGPESSLFAQVCCTLPNAFTMSCLVFASL